MADQVVVNTGVDAFGRQRIVEEGRSQSHRGGAGEQELNGVLRRFDSPLADDGNAPGPRDLVDLVHLQQRDGPDRRSREAALHVADDGAPGFHVDGHAHDRIDHGKPVGARLDAGAGVGRDVRLVGRQLGDQRFFRDRTAGLHHPRRHVRVIAEGHTALANVRTGNVDFHPVDG